jgi:hypothetical protein
MQGGEFGPKERSEEGHMCGAKSSYNTRFAVGQIAYICRSQV